MRSETLYRDILTEIEHIPTVDAHEHLPPEASRLGSPRDFYSLFEHYCSGDLVSSGASAEDMALFGDRSRTLAERWERFRPFLSRIRTGSYARSALLVVRDILGFDDLDDGTYEGVSAALQEMNTPGLYGRVLRDRCNLVACIECWCLDNGPYPDYFYHLAPGPEVVDLTSKNAVEHLGARCDRSVVTLHDLLDCMTLTVERWRANPKVVGIKSAHAYGRSLGFAKTPRADAEAIFERVRSGREAIAPGQAVALQDFLMFELSARAQSVGLPMVIHTGLQAGNYNRIANANPLLLQPLLDEFPQARVDLFHGGMPWVREIAVLAKYFPGVHLNMAWMHIISPEQARSALAEWLDLVPNNKIFGFGGDYGIVEKVYGHLTLARRTIATVLADKVADGAWSRPEASMVAHRMLYENPKEFYRLEC